MVSTTDFDSVSLGSSPSSPTKLTNMEETEKTYQVIQVATSIVGLYCAPWNGYEV